MLINKQLEHTSNNWNELLTTTRGGLEVTKFLHDPLPWKFNNHGIVTTNEKFDDIEIRIQQINKNESSLIPGISAKDKIIYLGVTSSRDGNQHHHLIIALDIEKEGTRIRICNSYTNLYLNSHFMTKLTYPFTSESFTSIQY